MVQIAFIFAFIISLASAVYGILIAQQLRKTYPIQPVLNHVLIQQILIFVFAFYGVWGDILTQIIFKADVVNESVIDKISLYIALFSVPFLLGGWFFQILISLQLRERKYAQLWSGIMILASMALGLLVSQFVITSKLPEDQFKTAIGVVSFSIYTITVFNFARSKRCRPVEIFLISFVGFVLSIGTLFEKDSVWITILYIASFFVLHTWLPVLFKISFHFKNEEEAKQEVTFSDFCTKFEISKRESEIIHLICQGLANKEIAEKLFITLQTVKDHTSRIYLKTEVKNRTQLANLVREFNN